MESRQARLQRHTVALAERLRGAHREAQDGRHSGYAEAGGDLTLGAEQ